jgi:chaperonin GroES
MTIQPLRDFILVEKPAETEKRSAGGIIVPGTSEAKVLTARVLAVGSGKVALDGTVVPLEVKVGDSVVFNKNFATEINAGSETVLLLREEQIFAVVR